VLFCDEVWQEELEFTQVTSKDMYNHSLTLEERSHTETNHFNWTFPCKFQHEEQGAKDMWVYFMYYNLTLAPAGKLFVSLDKPSDKD